MLDKIYQAMMADTFIVTHAGSRIKYYEYPEAANMEESHIVIDPLDAPKPGDYGDNEILTDDFLYQVDIWSKDISIRDELAKRIRKVLKEIGLVQYGGGADEYDGDYGIYRDARRYRGKEYTTDFDT
ncbi:hypothetical protein [Terribacillus sp. DMT04]|uniref:hypothetical protein n=1 Tax=Terribacillus sp. DMT04 TaxID=2850441 RepID=UPI001C2BA7D4|nr:hypothetical protein [Terribacillus sp. DMT04]QXE02769.1 hypothetical protein KS242_06205 [Terribacillus sp. DMT04]